MKNLPKDIQSSGAYKMNIAVARIKSTASVRLFSRLTRLFRSLLQASTTPSGPSTESRKGIIVLSDWVLKTPVLARAVFGSHDPKYASLNAIQSTNGISTIISALSFYCLPEISKVNDQINR